MGKYWFKLVFFITLLLLIPVDTLQADAAVDYVPAGQVVEGPLLMAGERIRIDGIVDGDIYAAGNDISITGEVTGDIIAAAQNISISGPVRGDLRLGGQNVRLQGVTTGSATVFSQYLGFGSLAAVERDMLVFADSSRLEGNLQRNLKGSMEHLYISGVIGKDIEIFDVGRLELDNAQIGGNLYYRSLEKAVITPGTIITGEEHWSKSTPSSPQSPTVSYWGILRGLLINLAGLLVIWGVVRLWNQDFWQQIINPAKNNPGESAGIGLLLLLATPLLVFLLCITVIGIPAGLLILLIYGMSLYVSILIVAQYLAELIKPRINYGGYDIWLVLALLLLLMLVVKIPLVGWILGAAILSLGLGSIFKYLFPNKKQPDLPDLI